MNAGRVIRALCVCGPTASGKSDAALVAAEVVGGEIVNADSRQVYAGMAIGTGWPPDEAMRRVPHHLYGTVSPGERYNAVRFAADAAIAIEAIAARGRLPIVVGGTGMYVEALAGTMPMDRPAAGEDLRARMVREAQAHPQGVLRAWLAVLDPVAATRVPERDGYRTLRAIEAVLATRELGSSLPIDHGRRSPKISFTIVVLRVARDELRARIATRVAAMFAAGLEAEALAVRAHWPASPALTGIGFAEALSIADGAATRSEAVERTRLRTSQYAARQETWFRRLRSAQVVDAGNGASASSAVTRAARDIVAGT